MAAPTDGAAVPAPAEGADIALAACANVIEPVSSAAASAIAGKWVLMFCPFLSISNPPIQTRS